MIRIETGSRLHFGLLRLPPQSPWPVGERFFGGVGMMVEEPRVVVAVEPAGEWSATGPLAERALKLARLAAAGDEAAFRLTVEAAPQEHIGLGVGTQLALATACAIRMALGQPEAAAELARRVGRGARSAIGVHGFERGGLLIDGGKLAHDQLAPIVARCEFPEAWCVLLLMPPSSARMHGSSETHAFSELPAQSDDAMARLIVTGLLPSLSDRDFPAFSAALAEYNARAGELFRPVQGGTYSTPETTSAIDWLRTQGIVGAGQTSWGPTVFAMIEDEERARDLLRSCPVPGLVTRGRNAGIANDPREK